MHKKLGKTDHLINSFGINNQFLNTIDLELRSRVNNPAVNADCPSYYDRDECRTKNSRLTLFTVDIGWTSN